MTKSDRPESPKAIGVLKNMLRTVIEPLHPPVVLTQEDSPTFHDRYYFGESKL